MTGKTDIHVDTTAPEMKRPVQILYLALFAALVLAPVLVFLLVRDYVDTENYEQRTLAAFPFSAESAADGAATTIETFPSEFESWFEDHLPFRNQLLTLFGEFEYRVLKTSSSESVIVGKDGWLFYKGAQVADEDPVGDYMGTDLLTEEELQVIAANLVEMRDQLAEMGSDFYVYFAPNKERVYSEYMPDMYGEPAEDCTLTQVVEYLTANTDLVIVSSYDDLMTFREEDPDTQLYYKYDTHWNAYGAYVAAEGIVSAMGFGFEPLENLTVTHQEYANYDLARLLHLQKILTDDDYSILDGYTPHELKLTYEGDGTTIRYNTPDGQAPGQKLFVIGDSFSTQMTPYLACHFLNGYLTFYYNYTYEQLVAEQPSAVVYEAVERYIRNIEDFTLEGGYTGSVIEG